MRLRSRGSRGGSRFGSNAAATTPKPGPSGARRVLSATGRGARVVGRTSVRAAKATGRFVQKQVGIEPYDPDRRAFLRRMAIGGAAAGGVASGVIYGANRMLRAQKVDRAIRQTEGVVKGTGRAVKETVREVGEQKWPRKLWDVPKPKKPVK